MARTYVPKTDLSKLEYSPMHNPLVEPLMFKQKKKKGLVRVGRADELTQDVGGVATIARVEEKNDEEFVKVFAAGVAASMELSKTAQRVFIVVLTLYQNTPMSRGFADSINLFWFKDGIDGQSVGMSERTFKLGLRELLDKGFLYPKDSASFWTNPTLFFKGNRFMLINDYRRRGSKPKAEALETQGQQRIEGIE